MKCHWLSIMVHCQHNIRTRDTSENKKNLYYCRSFVVRMNVFSIEHNKDRKEILFVYSFCSLIFFHVYIYKTWKDSKLMMMLEKFTKLMMIQIFVCLFLLCLTTAKKNCHSNQFIKRMNSINIIDYRLKMDQSFFFWFAPDLKKKKFAPGKIADGWWFKIDDDDDENDIFSK